MSRIKFVPDLDLGPHELLRFTKFLVDDGYKKNILDNTVSFGLIKNNKDLEFRNARVSVDTDIVVDTSLINTIKINPISGINKDGDFFVKPLTNSIIVNNNGIWFWVRVSYKSTHQESGVFSLASDGTLSGVGGELTKVLRGKPNYPSKIRFPYSVNNIVEYEVLEIIDDNNVILNGVDFYPEENLKLSVIGTFTPGVAVPEGNKEIYDYDSCRIELVPEIILNTPPTNGFIKDKTFYLARVKVISNTVVVQDKRSQFWETKGGETETSIDRAENKVAGIESIQFQHSFSPKDKNVVNTFWGLRSSSWTVDSTLGILTIQNGSGGILKSVNDTTTGMFNGWRVYTVNGKYSRIYSSVKQGQTINLYLDILDMNSYSTDGGTTFLQQELLIVPDCEEVDFIFTPTVLTQSSQQETFSFPVNTRVGKCELVVYTDPTATYNVKYRLKNNKEFTQYKNINVDTVGYFKESSFNTNGTLGDVETVPVTSNGNITLTISPNAFKNFVTNIDKGDTKGVQNYTSLDNSNYDLIVGVSKNYIHIKGAISLDQDVVFNLKQENAIEGSSFIIHFNCTSISLNSSIITLVSDTIKLKEINQGDVWQMQNQDNGISFTCTYDGTNWVVFQNYNLGRPFEVISLDGSISEFFDTNTGLGKIKGYYGYALCNGITTSFNGVSIPDLSDKFELGYSATKPQGSSGGISNITLDPKNLPPHTHNVQGGATDSGGQGAYRAYNGGGPYPFTTDSAYGENGVAKPFSVLNPYYSVIKAKKLF